MQIIDRKTVGIPGPPGDASGALVAAIQDPASPGGAALRGAVDGRVEDVAPDIITDTLAASPELVEAAAVKALDRHGVVTSTGVEAARELRWVDERGSAWARFYDGVPDNATRSRWGMTIFSDSDPSRQVPTGVRFLWINSDGIGRLMEGESA